MGVSSTHKACLCTHEGMHQWGVNYWETYSPVVYWVYVRSIITLIILRDLHTKSVVFSWPTLRLV